MSCESKKQFLVSPNFLNKKDAKHWGFGEEHLFKMLNDIVNGNLK